MMPEGRFRPKTLQFSISWFLPKTLPGVLLFLSLTRRTDLSLLWGKCKARYVSEKPDHVRLQVVCRQDLAEFPAGPHSRGRAQRLRQIQRRRRRSLGPRRAIRQGVARW